MREIARSASKRAASVAQRNRPLVRTVEEVEREVDELAERLKFKEQEHFELAFSLMRIMECLGEGRFGQ